MHLIIRLATIKFIRTFLVNTHQYQGSLISLTVIAVIRVTAPVDRSAGLAHSGAVEQTSSFKYNNHQFK